MSRLEASNRCGGRRGGGGGTKIGFSGFCGSTKDINDWIHCFTFIGDTIIVDSGSTGSSFSLVVYPLDPLLA
jgi:hypothetical protein